MRTLKELQLGQLILSTLDHRFQLISREGGEVNSVTKPKQVASMSPNLRVSDLVKQLEESKKQQ